MASIRSDLIKISAKLILCENAPSYIRDDWKDLPPNLTRKGWSEIYRAAVRCQNAMREMGIELRKLADALEEDE